MPNRKYKKTVAAENAEIKGARLTIKGFKVLFVYWNDAGLVRIDWDLSEPSIELKRSVPEQYRKPLQSYFSGEKVDLSKLPIDLRGTAFQIKVWKALRSIPRGKVKSYGEIAAKIGDKKAARAVGTANKANPLPIVIPCHRVVAAGNRLGGYSGGLDRKRFLLKLEGVRVVDDRIV